jgi:hypothetical protein
VSQKHGRVCEGVVNREEFQNCDTSRRTIFRSQIIRASVRHVTMWAMAKNGKSKRTCPAFGY